MSTTLPQIASGAWSWGAGAAGGDQVFGNHLFEEELKPVFEKAVECGLNLWDTAAVYGEGTSERILGTQSDGCRKMDAGFNPGGKKRRIKTNGVYNHNLAEVTNGCLILCWLVCLSFRYQPAENRRGQIPLRIKYQRNLGRQKV